MVVFKPRTQRRRIVIVCAAVVGATLGLASLPLWAADDGPLELNQRFIEREWARAHAMTVGERLAALRSRYLAGLDRLLAPGPSADAIDIDDPRQVFEFVLGNVPSHAIVYPTETYYYYRFDHGHRRIAGNLRLLDAASGVVHIGYFDRDDRGFIRSASFGADDGVRVTTRGENAFRVACGDRVVTFTLPQRGLRKPQGLTLLEHEEFVSGILDESGVPLTLLFNRLTGGFYYALNEDIGPTETLIPIPESRGRCLLGARTRFLYFDEPEFGRKLLVGVAAQSVQANDYFDGPFDQVPPRLNIKAQLETAYPYTLLRGGIDHHGNFVDLDSQRVAISPYRTYDTIAAVVDAINADAAEALLPSERWDRLTYESKRRPLGSDGELGGDIPQYVAQGWPANHWGYNSARWPASHSASESNGWPPNHATSLSAK